ncbi:hypothetical protein [Streptomyces sp. NPDC059398]|uniref:hypothetical protein n=1 Tax=Streptomyces sp. NPDC059398 TaxID=3346820 RepID=UPI0036C214DE
MSAEPPPRRETVTGESRRVRPLPRRRVPSEPLSAPAAALDGQTALGDAYVRSLMRGQLRAGLGAFGLVALLAGTLPLAFAALRSDLAVWIVLGLGAYPVLVAVAWWYIRRAERNERDFARLVEGRPAR